MELFRKAKWQRQASRDRSQQLTEFSSLHVTDSSMPANLMLLCRVELSPLAELELLSMVPLLAQAIEDELLNADEAMEIARETAMAGMRVTLCC